MPEYVVVWWMSQIPYAARYTNRIAAEAAAHVRNGLMIRGKVDEIWDWFRRDDAGNPMPAEWREMPKIMPWVAAPHPEKL
jgi:hypothetical protein